MSFNIRKFPVKIDGDEHEIEFSRPVGTVIATLVLIGALCLLTGCGPLAPALGAATAGDILRPKPVAVSSSSITAGDLGTKLRLEMLERRLEDERRRDLRREIEELDERMNFIEQSQDVPLLPLPQGPGNDASRLGQLLQQFGG